MLRSVLSLLCKKISKKSVAHKRSRGLSSSSFDTK